MKTACLIDGCGKSVHGRGWCRSHYRRWARHGDPLAGRTPWGEPERFYREVALLHDGADCLIWPFGQDRKGYARIKRNGRTYVVARLVCEDMNGPAPTHEHQAAHSCGKGHEGCVNPRHLDWKTPTENQADRIGHGTHSRGEQNHTTKLTENAVLDILALKGWLPQRKIAKIYGVTPSTISAIQRRKSWGWLSHKV